jgi:hypothetical protein
MQRLYVAHLALIRAKTSAPSTNSIFKEECLISLSLAKAENNNKPCDENDQQPMRDCSAMDLWDRDKAFNMFSICSNMLITIIE